MPSGPNSDPNIVDGEVGEEAYPIIKLRASTPIPPFLVIHIIESWSHCPLNIVLLALFEITSWDDGMKNDIYCDSIDDEFKILVYWFMVVSWKHINLIVVIETKSLFPSLDTAVNLAV